MAGLIPFNRKNSNALSTGIDDFYSMIDNFFNDGYWARRDLMRDTFKVDVEETEDRYLIDAELPGVTRDQLSLNLEDGRLIIALNREDAKTGDGKNFIHRERRFTSMARSIYLADAQPNDISAKLEDGLLKISVAKRKKESNAHKIAIE
jgi:HSP20 family protein